MAPANEKQMAHELLDQLDAGQLSAVVHLLLIMTDPARANAYAPVVPVAHAIVNAPVDDESLSAEAIRALDQAREWLKHNKGIPHKQVLAELGLTEEEIEHSKTI